MFSFRYRNNEAARGLSEYNSNKMSLQAIEMKMVTDQNRENKIFRQYTVARNMYNEATTPEEKSEWKATMRKWASKITNDEEEEETPVIRSATNIRSTPTVQPLPISHNASAVTTFSRSTTQLPSMNSNSTTKKRMNFNEISQTTIKETKSLSDSGSDSESEFQSARDEAERVAKAKAKRGNN